MFFVFFNNTMYIKQMKPLTVMSSLAFSAHSNLSHYLINKYVYIINAV